MAEQPITTPAPVEVYDANGNPVELSMTECRIIGKELAKLNPQDAAEMADALPPQCAAIAREAEKEVRGK